MQCGAVSRQREVGSESSRMSSCEAEAACLVFHLSQRLLQELGDKVEVRAPIGATNPKTSSGAAD